MANNPTQARPGWVYPVGAGLGDPGNDIVQTTHRFFYSFVSQQA
ncbi:MAG: hypothetical protein Q7T00_04455 [Rugosibacter sp.]|jgi:hypothetical protein|nr:hypothetical protein [Rugosibacter sp.]